jgi:hypothetical protein
MSKRDLAFVLVPWLLLCGIESSRAESGATPKHPIPPSKEVAHTSKEVTHTSKGATRPSKGTSPLLTTRTSATATVTQKKVFAPMLQHVQTIQNTDFGHLPTVSSRLQQIARFTRNLQQLTAGSKVPSLYADALNNDARELGNLAATVSANKDLGAGDQTSLMQSFEDVHSDLAAKESFAEQNPSQPFAPVNVTVITRDKDVQQVSGYEVWYSLKGYYNYKDEHHYHLFDKDSSPTSQPIPAGNYMFWAAKEGKDGPPRPIDVGSDGQRKRSIDLETP